MIGAVSQRFEIEEIITQDAVGVLFRALEVETGKRVGLRRFFPFGADGGGLLDEEHAEYVQAVAHLAGVQVPGLRSIITGGCDPVDGMPYVATEWIEGHSLAEHLEQGSFPPEAVIAVLDRALEVCESLSVKLMEEAVWVEATPDMIVLDQSAEQRGYTFGICPIRWLVGTGNRRSLLPLAELAEDLMGWRGQRVSDQTGLGLGGWVKWLRAFPETITLNEARRALAGMTGNPPPAPVVPRDEGWASDRSAPAGPLAMGDLVMPPEPLSAASGLRTQMILIAVLLVLVAAVGGWVVTRSGKTRAVEPAALAAQREQTQLDRVNARAAALALPAAAVYQATDAKSLLGVAGREVTMEGVLKTLRLSESKTELYLEFEGADAARGCVSPEGAGLSKRALRGLVGKRLRLTGVVSPQPDNANLPEVQVTDRQSILQPP